jgi:predicted ATPase
LAHQHQFRQWEAMNRIVGGWCLAQQGEPEKATCTIEAALSEHERTGAQTIRPYFLLLLAESKALEGRLVAAQKTADEALQCADQHGEQTWTAEILRIKGEIALKSEECSTESAEAVFRAAINTASQQGAQSFELRAWISLGQLLARSQREEELRSVIRDVLKPARDRLLACDYENYRSLSAMLES